MSDSRNDLPPTNNLHDALDTWQAEAGGNVAVPLAVVPLSAHERLVIPFTTQAQTVMLHYLETPELTGYVHCLCKGCVLCKTGKQPDKRDLFPVFDVEEGAVGVLSVGPNIRAHALRPQFLPVLQSLRRGDRLLLTITRFDRGKYKLASQPLSDQIADGADKIQDFVDQFETGGIDLAVVFPRLANEDLAAIPKIANALRAKGISLA